MSHDDVTIIIIGYLYSEHTHATSACSRHWYYFPLDHRMLIAKADCIINLNSRGIMYILLCLICVNPLKYLLAPSASQFNN